MTGITAYTAQNVLNYITGRTAMPTLPTVYGALFTVAGTDSGTGFTEVSAGAYARVALATPFGTAASGVAPSTISNSAAINFPAATASWGNIIAFGIYDAATGGNLLAWDYLGNDPWFPFSCTLASPGVLTAIGMTAGSTPALANGAIAVVTAEYGGVLPTGLVAGTQYTVAGLAADTFNLGTNTTTTGSGMIRQVVPQTVPSGISVIIAAGSVTLVLS
jgi:hypothetical protein